MPDTTLIRGSYRSPRYRVGELVYCLYRGDVRVSGVTDAPIPWPYHKGCRQRSLPILCGDLIQAVRYESSSAVAHHWGISHHTVMRWRQQLEVPWFNEGTRAVWKRLAVEKLVHARSCRKFGVTTNAPR